MLFTPLFFFNSAFSQQPHMLVVDLLLAHLTKLKYTAHRQLHVGIYRTLLRINNLT